MLQKAAPIAFFFIQSKYAVTLVFLADLEPAQPSPPLITPTE